MEHGDRGRVEESIKDYPETAVPFHIVAMEERHRVGGQPAMARGAFYFSLQALCNMLVKTGSKRCVPCKNMPRSHVVVSAY